MDICLVIVSVAYFYWETYRNNPMNAEITQSFNS